MCTTKYMCTHTCRNTHKQERREIEGETDECVILHDVCYDNNIHVHMEKTLQNYTHNKYTCTHTCKYMLTHACANMQTRIYPQTYRYGKQDIGATLSNSGTCVFCGLVGGEEGERGGREWERKRRGN